MSRPRPPAASARGRRDPDGVRGHRPRVASERCHRPPAPRARTSPGSRRAASRPRARCRSPSPTAARAHHRPGRVLRPIGSTPAPACSCGGAAPDRPRRATCSTSAAATDPSPHPRPPGPRAPGVGGRHQRAGRRPVRRERRRPGPAGCGRRRDAPARRPRPRDVRSDVRFDVIWSNPPIRIGKAALHALLDAVARPPRPRRDGVLVVQKHLGADSLAAAGSTAQGWPTERLASPRRLPAPRGVGRVSRPSATAEDAP